MVRFQATVRILDVMEPDAPTARRTLQERLQRAGFSRWQMLTLHPQGAAPPLYHGSRRRPPRPEVSYASGSMLLGAILAWALWFLWLVAG